MPNVTVINQGELQIQQAKYEALLKKVMSDPAQKSKFTNDPVAVLGEAGIATPTGVTVTVITIDPKHIYLFIPA